MDSTKYVINNIYDKKYVTDNITVQKYVTPENLKTFYDELMKKFSSVPLVKHVCHSCGATLEIDSDKHIFHCPYCHSVYAIGTSMVNCE